MPDDHRAKAKRSTPATAAASPFKCALTFRFDADSSPFLPSEIGLTVNGSTKWGEPPPKPGFADQLAQLLCLLKFRHSRNLPVEASSRPADQDSRGESSHAESSLVTELEGAIRYRSHELDRKWMKPAFYDEHTLARVGNPGSSLAVWRRLVSVQREGAYWVISPNDSVMPLDRVKFLQHHQELGDAWLLALLHAAGLLPEEPKGRPNTGEGHPKPGMASPHPSQADVPDRGVAPTATIGTHRFPELDDAVIRRLAIELHGIASEVRRNQRPPLLALPVSVGTLHARLNPQWLARAENIQALADEIEMLAICDRQARRAIRQRQAFPDSPNDWEGFREQILNTEREFLDRLRSRLSEALETVTSE